MPLYDCGAEDCEECQIAFRGVKARKPTTHSYFIVMIDFGQRGLEAVVHPEVTRTGILDRVVSGEYDRERIVFIHHVDGLFIEDCTADILEEAAPRILEAAE
jgi:hypothetical protein